MANEVELFCGRLFRNNPSPSMLVLAGRSGVAKTHCLDRVEKFWRAAASASFERKHWPGWKMPRHTMLRWPAVVAQFKANCFGAIEDAEESDLLLLDDIGAENDPWAAGVDYLCQILSRRERRFTMITTNIEARSWGEKWDQRVIDRLFRNSVVVKLAGVKSFAIQSRL